MNELIKQINEFAKYQKRTNSKFKIFALSDPIRSATPIELDKKLEKDIQIIIRTFGNDDLLLDLKNHSRIFATIDSNKARKYKLSAIHIPSKRKNYLNNKNSTFKKTMSAHNLREIYRAIKSNADFIIVSVAFTSKSPSAKTKPLGILKIANICKIFPKANIIALGGINIKTAKRLQKTGIKGVAGVSFKN